MSKTIGMLFVGICYILFLAMVDSYMGSKSAVAVMLISAVLVLFVSTYNLPSFSLRRLPKRKYRILYIEMRAIGHSILLRNEDTDEDIYIKLPSIFSFEGNGYRFETVGECQYLVPLINSENIVRSIKKT